MRLIFFATFVCSYLLFISFDLGAVWCVLNAIVKNPAAAALLADAPPQMDPFNKKGASLPCVAVCRLWQVCRIVYSLGVVLVEVEWGGVWSGGMAWRELGKNGLFGGWRV